RAAETSSRSMSRSTRVSKSKAIAVGIERASSVELLNLVEA
ncbi:MAG: hypothetical protein ACI93T_001256, partial [Porticoccaceae bacterium]